MATTTRTRTTRTRKPRTVAAKTTEVPDVVDELTGETADEIEESEAAEAEAKTPEAEAPAPKAKAVPAYRTAEGFNEAAKSLRSLAKGTSLKPLVQLITHLAWKTPNGAVGWSKGTTADVISTADDLAIGTGTPITEAMDVALSAAEKEVGDPQREAFDVLAGIVRGHAA